MKHVVVGTAGHIDHGKSALVRALTGTDPDRLKEEKERGITIDLGFAFLQEKDDLHLGFVDVPGHERFVKNMLAGVGGIDLVMLVIAADESVMPQTREHFDICRLLKVERGITVITKSDLVDEELRELAVLEAKELVAGSFLESAPVVHVSSKTGSGLEELRACLVASATEVADRGADGDLRLPIDRVFTMKGFGTVVTGTLSSGSLSVDDEVEVLPQGEPARVRGLQVHGETTRSARAGQRTAVNLQGVDVQDLTRGACVVRPGGFVVSQMLDAQLEVLPSSPIPVKDLTRVHLHHNTSQVLARVRVLGGKKKIAQGETGFVQLRLEAPIVAAYGDRFILRRYSPLETIAGGVVIDAEPRKHSIADADTVEALSQLVQGTHSDRLRFYVVDAGLDTVGVNELRRRSGLTKSQARNELAKLEQAKRVIKVERSGGSESRWIDPGLKMALEQELVDRVKKFQRGHPLLNGMPKGELKERLLGSRASDVFDWLVDGLIASRALRAEAELLATPDHQIHMSDEEVAARDFLVDSFLQAGFQPPGLKELATKSKRDPKLLERVMRVMLKDGAVVQVGEGMVIHTEVLARLKTLLREYKVRDDRIDVGKFKEMTGVTRKHAIPLLEWLDRQRLTRREGNERVIL